jgi:hypothetical protein
MSDNENLDYAKVEAFFKSPAGIWTIVGLMGALVLGSLVTTVIGWFQ